MFDLVSWLATVFANLELYAGGVMLLEWTPGTEGWLQMHLEMVSFHPIGVSFCGRVDKYGVWLGKVW
ncbi:hypothetical protein DP73_11445 [Desulfosporosinus sp. HMP52]|nr:hypothetical protein DP73_11445 [Desulfosporosinus sp. HMP52]